MCSLFCGKDLDFSNRYDWSATDIEELVLDARATVRAQLPHFVSFDFIFICLFAVFIVSNMNVHLIHSAWICVPCTAYGIRAIYTPFDCRISLWPCLIKTQKDSDFIKSIESQHRLQPVSLLFAFASAAVGYVANKILSQHDRSLSISSNLHRHNRHRYIPTYSHLAHAFILWRISCDTTMMFGHLTCVCVCVLIIFIIAKTNENFIA